MPDEYFNLTNVWLSLSFLNKLFGLFFLAVAVKTLYSSSRILFSLSSLKKRETNGTLSSDTSPSQLLSSRAANLCQLHLLTLYLACFCLAMGAVNAYKTIENSKTPVGYLILRNLQPSFVYAAFVFLLLLFLHSLQWFVSARVNAAIRRLKPAPKVL